MGFADELHDLRERGFVADTLGFHDEAAAGIQRAAGDLVAFRFFGGHRFPGKHRFVDSATLFADHAVNRDPLAGAHAQLVAVLDLIEWDVSFAAVRGEQMSLLRGQIQQRANRAGGLPASAEFQHLSKQNQRRDHGGSFEIDGCAAVHPAKRHRKNLWERRGHNAVEIRGARPQADQRKHVWAAVNKRCPKTLKKRPTTPQHDRRGEDEFDPVAERGREMQTENFAEHGEGQNG